MIVEHKTQIMAPFTQKTDDDHACFTQHCIAFPFNLRYNNSPFAGLGKKR